MSAPSPLPTYIYKILSEAPPDPLPPALPLSDLDRKDGFIHLSVAAQVPGTASRFFSSATKLWLLRLCLDTFPPSASQQSSDKGRIIWEASGSHGVFPHLYDGNLGSGCVERVLAFERGDSKDWAEVLGDLPN